MHIPRICVQSDSLTVVNAVNGKSVVPKKIINIIEDIRLLLVGIKEPTVEYCSRNSNREADTLGKKANMYL